ncbi:hypothetical protein ACF9IK_10910 [Kitasatospora hibisci]|uniref:hypothetical protein n=1 Tax=Kitasatospora hibisci TaxID=3369522 RepID=UPI0037545508
MPASSRRLLAAALLCCAALTACGPADDAPRAAPAAPSSDAPQAAPAAPSSDAPSATATAAPTTAPTTASTPAVPATPTPACASAAYRAGHRVVQLASVGPTALTARPTRFVCGPDVPSDGYYEATGEPAQYTLAPTATATLVDLGHGEGAKPVPLTVLVQHADDCLAKRTPAAPYGCYGDKYDLVQDSQGRVIRIAELYHP